MKARPVRRDLLRHGPVDDARQAHELRGDPEAGRGAERLHQVRVHADARARQRHRRRTWSCGGRPAIRSASTCARGYPRFNPGEFSTVDLLVRGDNDAALILGADPGATMPQPGIDHLARIPTIVLDPKVTHTSRLARVHITTAATGISAPGHRLSHGRGAPAAAAGPQVAVSDRRGGHPAHPPGGGGEAAMVSCSERDDGDRLERPGRERPSPPSSDGDSMLRITGGKVHDPANGIHGVVQDVCIADGRIVPQVEGGRTIDATRHGRLPRRGRRPHPRRRRGAELRPGHHPGELPQGQPVRPHAGASRRSRRHHPHHLRDRLPVRRHGLDDRERGRRPDPVGPAHPRRAARHTRSWTRPPWC